MKRFFLGCHNSAWLHRHPEHPLFVSRRRMPKKPKAAVVDWALDSGGFTELQQFGRWTLDAPTYAQMVQLYHHEVGRLQWAAQQDWMCEPVVIAGGQVGPVRFHGTGLSVREHQERTVENYLELRELTSVQIVPVVQGYTLQEYHNCVELFLSNGVDLSRCPTVGVGSICRRQATKEATEILTSLAIDCRLPIHGFGLQREALLNVSHLIQSADSMAWSSAARYAGTSCGRINKRTGRPIANCANCYHAAKEWVEETYRLLGAANHQLSLF